MDLGGETRLDTLFHRTQAVLYDDPLSVLRDRRLRDLGEIVGLQLKTGAAPENVYALKGRLYLSQSGWLLLQVPNAIIRGLFQALDVPGAELPLKGGQLNSHVSVMTDSEVAAIGADKITERGRMFSYQLGPVQEVEPAGWKTMSRVWFVRIISPELKKLRVSYGLTPLPHVDHELHATIATRRKGVFVSGNAISKAADEHCPAGECCPHCGARLERGDDGRCNRCGEAWRAPITDNEPSGSKAAADKEHRHFKAICRCGGTVAECSCTEKDKPIFATQRPCKECKTRYKVAAISQQLEALFPLVS